jgi:uncharacterized membrane protein
VSEYLVVKWLHVLSSTLLFGTGVGSAFYMLRACLSREPRAAWFVIGNVVIGDWLFTGTSVIVQAATGIWLARLAGFPMDRGWLLWSIVLYAVAVGCWLPVVVIQMRMRDLARQAAESGSALPANFWRAYRWWVALGIPAFFSLLAVFWLMIAKPA